MTRPLLLVLRALGLGDLLTAVPALRGLARAFPDHHRVLAAPAALSPLIGLIRDADGRPIVDELLDTAPLAAIAIRHGRPSVAVNLHGCGPESHRLLLALAPRRLLAFAHEDVPESSMGPRWQAEEHEVSRWCRLLLENGIDCDPEALDIDRPTAASARLPALEQRATLLHPGAASLARRWPAERWAAVAAAESAAGREVLISGGPGEVDLALSVAREAGLAPAAVLAGQTDLRELAGAVAAADRIVCSDTGVAHLASALRTPSVVLFGPTPPDQWGPPARECHRVLWMGSRGDPHAETPDGGLLQISVGDVLGALNRLPAARAARASVADAPRG